MKPYHKNPRKINDKQLNDLRRWLDELGDLSGIVHDMNSDEIIGGNQRTAVLGFTENDITITEQLPEPDRQGTVAHGYILWHGARYAYRQVAWTPEQCERANIIANKAGGDWEIDRLLSEFETAVLLDSGFEQDELDSMLAELEKGKVRETADAEPQTSRADELKQEWATETGQLWILPSRTEGQEHRLICGDCTDKAVVERVMSGEKADMFFTDPPYGVAYADKNKWLNAVAFGNRIQEPIENDHKGIEDIAANLWQPSFSLALECCCDTASFYLFMPQGGDQMMMMMMMMNEAGWLPRHELIWLKNNHVLGRADYNYKHEPILYGWKRKGTHRFYGGFQTSVIECNKPQNSDMHPTTKPIALIEQLIPNNTEAGGLIYDPFLGSGTTIIAAENLSRQCRAIEINPAYVAVALQRYLDAFQIRPYLAQ